MIWEHSWCQQYLDAPQFTIYHVKVSNESMLVQKIFITYDKNNEFHTLIRNLIMHPQMIDEGVGVMTHESIKKFGWCILRIFFMHLFTEIVRIIIMNNY